LKPGTAPKKTDETIKDETPDDKDETNVKTEAKAEPPAGVKSLKKIQDKPSVT